MNICVDCHHQCGDIIGAPCECVCHQETTGGDLRWINLPTETATQTDHHEGQP